MFITLLSASSFFFSLVTREVLKGNKFYNGEVADWKKKRNAEFNVLVTLALNILLWLLAGAALSKCPVFSSSILVVNVQLV